MLVLTYSPLYSNHFLFAPETGNAFNYGHCSGSKPLRYHPSSETGSGNLVQMVPQQTPSKAQGRAVEWKGGTYAQLQEGFCDAREGRCRPAGHGGNLRVGGQQEGDDGHFKSGCGKGLLVQAPGVAACRKLHKVCHVRLADLFDDLMRCRSAADGSLYARMDYHKRAEPFTLDDFPPTLADTRGAIDLLEIIESRESRVATLVASQLEASGACVWRSACGPEDVIGPDFLRA